MARGLDHIVHAVRDLDAAAEQYRRLGFTVGARNRHPWGTHNHVIQLAGFFVELLTIAEADKLGSDGFSQLFGRFNQSFLAHRQGLSMLVLESANAAADAAAFRSSGIGLSPALTFERAGKRPDGSAVKVAFSLAFARDENAPEAGFFTCQQHFPENFWNPSFQKHPNTASTIAGVVLVAENPADHHIFLSAFTGVRALSAVSGVVGAPTARGQIRIMDPAAFRAHFHTEPPALREPQGMRLAAIEFGVNDNTALVAALQAGGIKFAHQRERVIVGPEEAMGATIAFG